MLLVQITDVVLLLGREIVDDVGDLDVQMDEIVEEGELDGIVLEVAYLERQLVVTETIKTC